MTIEVRANGRRYTGWKQVRIERGVDRLAGSFALTVADKPWPIRPGDGVEVRVAGQLAITGWVDRVASSYGAASHEIEVSGRSRTADLVDCCSEASPGQWSGLTVDKIAAELAAPFGLKVRLLSAPGEVVPVFSIDQGRRVGEMLEELARSRGLLATDDPAGAVVLVAPGAARASGRIERGRNVLAARGEARLDGRFSRYVVKAQQPSTDQIGAEGGARVKASAEDARVGRYRPLVLTAGRPLGPAAAQELVDYEARVRFGRALEASYTLAGWTQPDGRLWTPGELVGVKDDWLRLDGDLLIAGVAYRFDGNGRRCELRLVRPEAYARPPAEATGATGAAASSMGGGDFWADAGL